MQFLYPGFLWALLALLIPIIIHLFYFRRFKKVYFTNVKFLKEIKEETSSRSKLKNFLVLLSRLLALAALVFAFAQPIINKEDKVDNRANLVSIFVDNSFSMNALSEDVPLIEKAKSSARSIVSAYTEEDKFQILSHELTGKQQRLLSKEDALERIDEIVSTAEVSALQRVITRQSQALNDVAYRANSFIISDFQKNISDFELGADTTQNVNLIPLQSVKEENVSIDSVWFNAPVPIINQANELLIKLQNYSTTEAQDVSLSIFYDGQNRPLGSYSIAPNTATVDTINLFIRNAGWQEAEFSISDYPVQYDDNYKISFNVKENVKVLSINESRPNNYLTAAFDGLGFFSIDNRSKNKLQYSEFDTYDLIILNDLSTISSGITSALQQYIENGGNTLIFPGSNLNQDSYNQLLNQLKTNNITEKDNSAAGVSYINKRDFIFDNVFEKSTANLKLPATTSRYLFTNYQNRGEQILLRYRDGKSFISKYVLANGQVYICASSLNPEYNDLVRNAEIFVPMLYKMALSKGVKERVSYTIGIDKIIETDRATVDNETVFKVKSDTEFIPAISQAGNRILLDMHDQIKTADFYDLQIKDELISKLAFNFDRKESDLDYFTKSELDDKYGDRASIIAESNSELLTERMKLIDEGMPLWRWCILGVLLFLLIETFLLRFWKT